MKKGFTLIEVMLASSILAFSIVLIFQAFFILLNYFDYYLHYLDIAHLMDEKIWQVKNALMQSGPSGLFENQGVFTKNNKNYKWNLNYNLIDEDLYQIDLFFSWQEGKRNIKLFRRAYAFYKKDVI